MIASTTVEEYGVDGSMWLQCRRVQQVSSSSGPVERVFGIRSVEIKTAHGSAVSIDGLEVDAAEKLRDYVGGRIKLTDQEGTGLTEIDPEHAETLVDPTGKRSGFVQVESLPSPKKVSWLRFRCHTRNIIATLPTSLFVFPLVILFFVFMFVEFFESIIDLAGTLFILSWGFCCVGGFDIPYSRGAIAWSSLTI